MNDFPEIHRAVAQDCPEAFDGHIYPESLKEERVSRGAWAKKLAEQLHCTCWKCEEVKAEMLRQATLDEVAGR